MRLARSSDLRFANDLERDIKHVQGLIAARGLLDKQHDDQLAD
ncbi:hypothetical protein [Rhodococcus qingshengii]|nr:hypothetical protein [Rhodococcus qingshengii]